MSSSSSSDGIVMTSMSGSAEGFVTGSVVSVDTFFSCNAGPIDDCGLGNTGPVDGLTSAGSDSSGGPFAPGRAASVNGTVSGNAGLFSSAGTDEWESSVYVSAGDSPPGCSSCFS